MSNPYLEGNYSPVTEEISVTDLEVTGTLPDHLDGRYLRTGPNPLNPDPANHHWFLGDGMVHGIRLRDGQAEWYRNRWVRSGDVAAALGEPTRPGPRHGGMDFAPNTHIIGHAGRLLALVEAGSRPYEMSFDLDTVGPCDFDGTLPGGFTAHPKLDPATGELHAVAYFFGWGDQVQYLVVGADGRVRRTVDIPTHGSPMMHDFSLTDRHVVLYDLPVRFDLAMAAEGASLPYRWDPGYPARVGVMPREGGAADVQWFDVEPCYVFHPMNAWSTDTGQVVLDVIRHPRMFDRDRLGPNEGPPSLHRWTVDLSAGAVREQLLDDRPQEFPRVDERLTGRPHRYGYTVGVGSGSGPAGDDTFSPTTVFKHDLGTGHDTSVRHDIPARSTARDLGTGNSLSELVFAERDPDAGEDDGVLLGFVHRADADRSDLLILDAGTLDTVAEVHLPVRVPQGFHGSWVPSPS